MAWQIPTKDKVFSQPNDGDSKGNLFATWGIDFEKNRGKMNVSEKLVKVFDETDDADFDSYMADFQMYKSKYYGVADKVFVANPSSVADLIDGSQWTELSGAPTINNETTDTEVFDDLFVVIDGSGIDSYNGSSWANNWVSGIDPYALETASDGNLYILTDNNYVYKKVSDGSGTGALQDASTGEDGTLDFSARNWSPACIESTSTRLFVGFNGKDRGEKGAIAEWDMSATSTTANKVHILPTQGVQCIAIKNDFVVAVLSDGRLQYHNGVSFVDLEGFQFPKSAQALDSDWLHKNGWDIIDDMIHFTVSPKMETPNSAFQDRVDQMLEFPAGVWALEPEIGMTCRFPVTQGATDYGQMAAGDAGALFAVDRFDTKFLTSYEYLTDGATAVQAILAGHDKDKSLASRAFFITQAAEGKDVLETVELLHRKLGADDEIRIYYRQYDRDPIVLDGVWGNTKAFHTTDSIVNVEKNDVAFVKVGNGAGLISKITNTEAGTNVGVVTLEDANTNATQNDFGALEVTNFRFMGKITDNTLDYHDFAVPKQNKSRKLQLLVELRQAASSRVELDYCIM